MRECTNTTIFLNEVFDIPYNVGLQLKHSKNFIKYGLWKEITEEQFDLLYQLAQEGKYGDFFYIAEKMNTRRKHRRINERFRERMKDPEFRKRMYQSRNEYRRKKRRNKNAMDRKIQTE